MVKYLPYLAIIFAALLWSADALLRQSLYTLSPLLVITLEHGIGALIFLAILKKFWPEIKKLRQAGWISILWISLLGGICGTYFYTKALSYVGYIDLSVVVLLQKFQPVFAMSLAAIILNENLSKRYIILAMMAIIGGYFITFGNNSFPNWDDNSLIAALFADSFLYQKPINKYEQRPTPSHPKNNCRKLSDTTRTSIEKVKSER